MSELVDKLIRELLFDKIPCRICGKKLDSINRSHLKTHNITVAEYKAMFPGAPLVSEEFKSKSTTVPTEEILQKRSEGLSRHWKEIKGTEKYNDIRKNISKGATGKKKHFQDREAWLRSLRKPKPKLSELYKSNPELLDKAHDALRRKLKLMSPEERKQKFGSHNKGRHHDVTRDTREKIREKVSKYWKENREKMVNAMLVANSRKPNKFESDFINLCKQNGLRNIDYVGNGSFWITVPKKSNYIASAINPDFVVRPFSQTRKIIELIGNHWHSHEEVEARKKVYKDLAVNALFITDEEFYRDVKQITNVVKNFVTKELIVDVNKMGESS